MSFVENPAQSVSALMETVGYTFEFLFNIIEIPAKKLLVYVEQ